MPFGRTRFREKIFQIAHSTHSGTGAAAFAFMALTSGCASLSHGSIFGGSALPDDPISPSQDSMKACSDWTLPLHAHLSHLSVSTDGRYILVSTSGERGSEGRIRLVDAKRRGKILWARNLKQPVKAQSLSADGSRAVISCYNGKTYAFDLKGKQLWEKDHLGRPVVLSHVKRIAVFNDDDSDPKTAFTSYRYDGTGAAEVSLADKKNEKKLLEPLDMEASDDEKHVVVTATDQSVFVYDLDGKLQWRGTLAGDSVSIAALGKAGPRIFSLTSRKDAKGAQTISAYLPSSDGKLVQKWSKSLDRRYEIVRAAGDTVFLYGNTHDGQALAAYSGETGSELWRRSYQIAANYSALVFTGQSPQPTMTVAIDRGSPAGKLNIMGISALGLSSWNALVEASSGLYSYAYAEKGPAVVAGSGDPNDSVVEYFRIQKNDCKK